MSVRVSSFVVSATAVALIGSQNAGYFSRVWGWSTIAFALLGALALLRRRDVAVSAYGGALVGALTIVVAWTAASTAWSISVPRTVEEIERGLVYVATAAALLAVAQSRLALVMGALAGATLVSIDALVLYSTQSAPDRFEGILLFRPIGYANGLGALAAIGLLLALGLAGETTDFRWRSLATAAVAPLAGALERTESRGAIVAIALALPVMLVFARRRSEFIAALLPGLATASAAAAIASAGGPHTIWLLPALLGIGIAGGAVSSYRVGDWRLVAGALAAALAVLAFAGHHGIGLGDRPSYWRAALVSYAHDPVGGTGAGTFELDWLLHRRSTVATRDAHSLELETLAELGPFGLAAVLAMLAVPFASGLQRRGEPLIACAAGGYCVLVVHSALDWDWEQPAVWLLGLIAAVALVVDERAPPLPRRTRLAGGVALVAVALLAAGGLAGNIFLHSARADLDAGRVVEAGSAADRAARWQPWASAPLLLRARVDALRGLTGLADSAARKAVDADPHDPAAWGALAALSPPQSAAIARTITRRLDPLGSRGPGP